MNNDKPAQTAIDGNTGSAGGNNMDSQQSAGTGNSDSQSMNGEGNVGSQQSTGDDAAQAGGTGNGDASQAGGTGNGDASQAGSTGNGMGSQTDGNGSDASQGTAGTDGGNAQQTAETDGGNTGNSNAANDEMSELMRLYTLTLEGMKPLESLDFPADSSEYSAQLASQALSLCSQGTKQMTAKLFTSSGFEVLLQTGYEKDKSDPSHTCAFTMARKDIVLNGKNRELLVISIRGTESGEWFSNFDFAASHSDEAIFAENFLQAAQDVYIRILPTLLEHPDAVILVCGHSRGAACANLLGMTLDDRPILTGAPLEPKENVYVYTFATPCTIRDGYGYDTAKYTNIFNLINPADLVTYLPIAGWGYKRIGKDLILNGNSEIAAQLKNDTEVLGIFVPSISEYYGRKMKVEGLEGFDDGITAYETMLALASSMTGIECAEVKGLKVTDIYRIAGSNSASDGLYAIVNFLKNMVGTDGNMNLNVFKQHMPAVYQELIAEYDY